MEADELDDAYRSCGAIVHRRCLRLLRDTSEALDATQETFLAAVRHRRQLRPGRELVGWLYRVATNLCLDRLRAGRMRGPEPSEWPGLSPEAAFESRLLARHILLRFDKRTQEIAVYAFLDGMTQDEIAEVLGISPRTVRNHLARVRAEAQRQLELPVARSAEDVP